MEAEVERIAAGGEGLLFLPYFTQASSTVLKGPGASGVLFGLNYQHTSFHVLRAIMEAIGLIYKNIADRMVLLGLPVEEISLGGGGSRSQIWRQIIAHILGRPVIKTVVEEASALGAAMMAAVGLGYYGDPQAAAAAMVREEHRCHPDPSLFGLYRQIQDVFNQVHASLGPVFVQQKEIWKDPGPPPPP
jgi:xylulokinase